MAARVPIVVRLTAPESAPEVEERLGISLAAMHPGSSSAALRRFFVASAASDKAKELIRKLKSDPAVDAAYTKPADEPP